LFLSFSFSFIDFDTDTFLKCCLTEINCIKNAILTIFFSLAEFYGHFSGALVATSNNFPDSPVGKYNITGQEKITPTLTGTLFPPQETKIIY
jgi:hypothetical protein